MAAENASVLARALVLARDHDFILFILHVGDASLSCPRSDVRDFSDALEFFPDVFWNCFGSFCLLLSRMFFF